MHKPRLDPKIFWDTDFAKLKYTKHADAIIVRVLERGGMNDWNEIKRYYGHDRIKVAAMGARSLSKKTLHFVAHLYDVPLTQFRCYNSNLFPELHWMY
jgi:hypothetical protein